MKPILFNTTMTQAILAGRKTVTRRVVKPQPELFYILGKHRDYINPNEIAFKIMEQGGRDCVLLPPYQPGDILYVRETWAQKATINSWLDHKNLYEYRADYTDEQNEYRKKRLGVISARWKPSIHMPKEAARIFLRVTGVRVERLQEILCGDMRREGCIPDTVTGGQYEQWQRDYWIPLWDSTIKKQDINRCGWAANPWVWVIEFERISRDESEGVTP